MHDQDHIDLDLFGENRSSVPSEHMDIEKQSLRTKDLHHLKIPALPETASAYRTWRNAVRTSILSFDQSPEGHLTPWLAAAFNARGVESDQLRESSGDFPRFDRVIASILCKPEVLKTSFGLRVQSYVEACKAAGAQIRGRYIINQIAREYDASAAAGAITSSLELFQLPAPQDGAAALKHWRDKVVYILSQLPTAQRPNQDLMSQWLYNTLKKHPLLRRTIDKFMDSPLDSYQRTFDALWQGVETALVEAQYDANVQSIKDDLKKGPTLSKKAMPAAPNDGKAKSKGSKGSFKEGGKSSNKGKGASNTSKTDSKPKDTSPKEKGGGPKGATPPAKSLTNEEKASSPCIYFAKNRCMRGDSCPYSHSSSTTTPKRKASSAATSSPHAPSGRSGNVDVTRFCSCVSVGAANVLGFCRGYWGRGNTRFGTSTASTRV